MYPTDQITSTPPIVDFVLQDNNNLITTHYFKRLDSLIVPTAGAVLRTALNTLQHCSSSRSSIYLHPIELEQARRFLAEVKKKLQWFELIISARTFYMASLLEKDAEKDHGDAGLTTSSNGQNIRRRVYSARKGQKRVESLGVSPISVMTRQDDRKL